MKFIGTKISVKDTKQQFSVVVSGKGERWEQALLALWTLAFLAVGVYFMQAFAQSDDRNFKLFVVIFLSFWMFYLSKAFSILFWRINGYHSLRLVEDKLLIRHFNGFKSKERAYFVQNIERIEVLEVVQKSINNAYYSGFWVKGLMMINFMHKGKKVGFAPQISSTEAKSLAHRINKKLIQIKRQE